jgi:hypothetical protein
MKVRAKFAQGKFGFAHDRRVYDGDEFDIDPKQFSAKWMEKVEDDEDEKPRRGRKPKGEQLVDADEVAE